MSRMSNYPNGFANGITIRGLPIAQVHPGKVFFANNSSVFAPIDNAVAGADTPSSGTFASPFASINYAKSQCTAGRGDIIYLMPGHAETIADATDLASDVAGIAVIGLGQGSLRPTLTLSDAASNIPITAANVSFSNILFVADDADVVAVFTATGTATPTDFTVENCEFRDPTSILNFLKIVQGNATANSMNGLYVSGNRVHSLGTTAATTMIGILEDADFVTIKDNWYIAAALADTPCLMTMATFNLLALEVSNNKVYRWSAAASGGILIEGSTTASTGLVSDNQASCSDPGSILLITTGSKLGFVNNLVTGAADLSGFVLPAIDADS